jgi:nucleotide-binding universal stress UspA family protein
MTRNASRSRVTINNILFATDFSPASDRLLPYSLAIAKQYGSEVILTHVILPELSFLSEAWSPPLDPDQNVHRLQTDAEQRMAELGSSEGLDAVPHEAIVRTGEFREVLTELIEERTIELVVLATHAAGGLSKLLWGSMGESILRDVLCPVMIAGPNVARFAGDRFGRIVFATNFSDASARALRYAISMAQRHQAGLTMLHSVQSPRGGRDSDRLKKEAESNLLKLVPSDTELSCGVDVVVEFGDAGEVVLLVAELQSADLIIMGAHPARAASTYLPSTVHHVLQHSRCPVLTVRGDAG